MKRKTQMFRGIKTGFNGTRRVLNGKSQRKRSHKQKWTGIAVGEFVVATVSFTVFTIVGGTTYLIIGVVMTIGGSLGLVASRATPPEERHTVQKRKQNGNRRDPRHDPRVTHGTFTTTPVERLMTQIRGGYGGDRPRPLLGRKPCGARCQYSQKPAETCNCSCGGSMHGIHAPAPVIKKKRAPAKRKPATSRKKPVKKAPRQPKHL